MKKPRPVVTLPKYVIINSMLGSSNGKIDRKYLRMMAEAIHFSEKRKNEVMRKTNRDFSEIEN